MVIILISQFTPKCYNIPLSRKVLPSFQNLRDIAKTMPQEAVQKVRVFAYIWTFIKRKRQDSSLKS